MIVLSEERRKRVLQIIKENGSAAVTDLSSLMNVSTMTIRRDIAHLASQGLVVKTHGGAVWPTGSTASEPRYEAKAEVNVREKQRIGVAAAEMVRDGETVLLDSGSTTYQIARSLRGKRGLTVVTNDLVIASDLSKSASISLLLVGGSVRPGIFSTVGPYAEEMLRQLSVDKAFLAADAVNLEKGILNSNPEEVPVKRLMVRAGRETILVVDHSKFDKLGLSFVCDIEDVDMIITDSGVHPEIAAELRERGLAVKIC